MGTMTATRTPETEFADSPFAALEPAWDIALLFPPQGYWSEEEYLRLAQMRWPGSLILLAPYRVRVKAAKYREPDLLVLLPDHVGRAHEEYCEQPDLVIEIVSPEYRKHDLETKRREYAHAGIPEYWIIDPQEKTITELALSPKRSQYDVHGVFSRGGKATSSLLKGIEVNVNRVFDSPRYAKSHGDSN